MDPHLSDGIVYHLTAYQSILTSYRLHDIIYTYNHMNKTLKSVGKTTKLLEADITTRSQIIAELPKDKKDIVLENLVESAMVLGITEPYQIIQWLGSQVKGIGQKSITVLIPKIKERWLAETEDIVQHAKEHRAMQISKALEEIRECEKMYKEAEFLKDRAMIKKLQLEWMQYLSKLTFVDKLVEPQVADTNINIVGGFPMLNEGHVHDNVIDAQIVE